MPEKGGYSLTVRKETALRVREHAENRGLTVDEFINELMRPSSKGVWSTCTVCGACARSWKFGETHGQGASEEPSGDEMRLRARTSIDAGSAFYTTINPDRIAKVNTVKLK